MATKSHTWITVWFALCIPIMCMECTYLFLRPRTLEGGDLHWLYKPVYGPYVQVDKSYGIDAFERGDGFPNAQSLLNAFETLISIYYIYLRHISGSAAASVFGLICASMTFSKTLLFVAMEYFCGWCTTGHNDPGTTFWLWFMPLLPWLVMPGWIMFTLGQDMVNAQKSETSAKKTN